MYYIYSLFLPDTICVAELFSVPLFIFKLFCYAPVLTSRLLTHHIRDEFAAFRRWYPPCGHRLHGRPSSSLHMYVGNRLHGVGQQRKTLLQGGMGKSRPVRPTS